MEKTYTLDEIQKNYPVTKRTLYSYIKTGRLNAARVGRQYLVTEENLRKFLNGTKRI